MRLKSSIFLWVSLATIIPLTALILVITAYSERLHHKNVESEIQTSIKNIISELEFRQNYVNKIVLSLATSPAIKNFFPVLQSAAENDLHPNYFEEAGKLNRFLAGFQHSVPGLDTVRVLDIDGNTLVKIRFGKHLPALFESMEDIPFAEEELIDEHFLSWMMQLQPYQVSYGQLPLSQRDYAEGQELSLLNLIVPLADSQDKTVGFLTARTLGNQMDNILQTTSLGTNVHIVIAELNPDNPTRNGMLLYSDTDHLKFSVPRLPESKINTRISDAAWQLMLANRYGTYHNSENNQNYFFQEFYPYKNQLVSWMIMLQMDERYFNEPFQRIRFGLFAFAAFALIISLLLANMGAKHIAEPITRFSHMLKKYADGEKLGNEPPEITATELKELNHSFNYLVNTLESTEKERDRAQNMMLQNAKLASIGEMAAGIGHEINNPLNNILSYAKLIERDIADDNTEIKEDIVGLRNEALRASRIIKGILNFARQVPPEYKPFNLGDWLKDTLLLVEPEAHKHKVTTSLINYPDIQLEGDYQQLQQVLLNLLINAIQVSKQGQEVKLTAQIIDDHQIQVMVSDQGKGLSADEKEKIFDPFFTTKSIGEGSGLGLSISLGIVQYHHGQLKLENNTQGGVDAIILLPIKNTHYDS
ncbi:MAG: HAMP domain-containing histidine kinase [Gammaproteobacteria bacterium]|nr:HAMP domain-containing histidine kinase [Gammaproteobacteria bacterium]MCW8909488.1 HAMP domain-containing histidine kinase [Gammaproteobacteria bacterium]MCW9006086.1 HAMP domain-containing histidine kinase [Gammaproteobacteria bacterium]MCW9056910.1 HAMP domain-containing histidine kinase [Gammaproteobacteria bacterium]